MEKKRSSGPEEDTASAQAPQPQLPWGMEKKEMQPSSLTSLTDDKLARFVLGHQKKTKFQKEREDREAKKRQADEEAARIYATFVASFDNEDETKGKAFVRSAAQGNRQTTRQSGDVYRLKGKESRAGFDSFIAGKKVSEMDKMLHEIKQKEVEQMQHVEPVQTTQKPKKRRAIDDFLDEMKERGPAPVSMEGMVKGSFDNGNPDTTNLYVGNLAPTVTEEVLEAEFGRYGEIYSVKIMWPRSEEERARKRNCGFVSFYERRDADDARVNLDNKELEGQPMIVGWGKAVKIQPRERSPGVLLPSAVSSTTVTPVVSTVKQGLPVNHATTIEIPTEEVRRRVDHLAHYVARDGLQFENAIRMREANNMDYRFLFEPQSATALYYRWRVFSLAMGDTKYSWREDPFRMTDEGPLWIPPKVPTRAHESRRRGFASRPSGRSHQDKSLTSNRQSNSRSRSYSRSKSRSFSPRKLRHRSRSSSRRRSRSGSLSSDNDHNVRRNRRRRSRSRSHGRRSHSWSSDDLRKRSRHSRSRSRKRIRHERIRQDKHVDNQSVQAKSHANKNEKLLTGQQIARARDSERGRERNRLSGDNYEDFKKMLSELTLERESVKKTMGFALDNSEAAVDLVNIISESFKTSSSFGITLIGLLYVTSDILHNSSAAVKNASLFRTTFQECLPEIMDTLRIVHKNIAGRMSANAMKEKVMNVLSAWESWSLFPPAVLLGLHATFLRKVEEDKYLVSRTLSIDGIGESDLERLRKTCRQSGIIATGDAKRLVARLEWLKEFTSPAKITDSVQIVAMKMPSAQPRPEDATPGSPEAHFDNVTARKTEEVDRKHERTELDGDPIGEEALDGDPIDDEPVAEDINDIDGEPMDDEELDGEPLDEDAAEDEIDGEPLDEIDGEPADDEDIDGVQMDEDMDGEPI